MRQLTVGSLFTGIAGFDLGLSWAGFDISWQVEIDDRCFGFLERTWPGVKRFRDVRDVGRHNLSPVDLICAGVPCQPASRAGKQRGKADDRWLWPEALRVIQELKPTWAVLENPPGIGDVGLSGILSDLAAQGYERRVFGVPACAVGSPQIRMRYFIVANSIDGRPNGSKISTGERETVPLQSRVDSNHRAHRSSERRQQISGSSFEDEGEYAGRTAEGDYKPSGDVQGDLADEPRRRLRIDGRSSRGAGYTDKCFESDMADAGVIGRNKRWDSEPDRCERTGPFSEVDRLLWSRFVWIPCADGKVRRAPSDAFLLADGVLPEIYPELGQGKEINLNLHRSVLAALGNSVVPQVVYEIAKAIRRGIS